MNEAMREATNDVAFWIAIGTLAVGFVLIVLWCLDGASEMGGVAPPVTDVEGKLVDRVMKLDAENELLNKENESLQTCLNSARGLQAATVIKLAAAERLLTTANRDSLAATARADRLQGELMAAKADVAVADVAVKLYEGVVEDVYSALSRLQHEDGDGEYGDDAGGESASENVAGAANLNDGVLIDGSTETMTFMWGRKS